MTIAETIHVTFIEFKNYILKISGDSFKTLLFFSDSFHFLQKINISRNKM